MKRLFTSLTVVAGLHAQTLWHGDSGGYRIQWSAANLEARPIAGAGEPFDARAQAQKEWQRIRSDKPAKEEYSAEFDYTLLSVVDSVMSFEYGAECDCGGAHPSASTIFLTLDLLKRHAAASLLDYFAPATLYAALMKDDVVKAALGEKKPTSFAELSSALQDAHYATDGCDYTFESDFLSHFAFYDYRPGFVDVRISLPYAYEVCRGSFIQLGLELPVSDAPLKTALANAQLGRHGILMKALQRKAGKDTSTIFSFPETPAK